MHRCSFLKYVILTVLVVGGVMGGLYLSGGWSNRESTVPPPDTPAPISDVSAEPPPTHRFRLTTFDAKDTVEAPDLAASADGSLFLTWASKTGPAERTVFFTRSRDGGELFDYPKAINKAGIYRSRTKEGGKSGYERRSTPHLVANETGLHLTWGEARSDGSGMRMMLATSTDAGSKFGTPQPVHSGEHANPTFTALTSGPGGVLACAWLDDQAGVQQPFASVYRPVTARFEPEVMVNSGPSAEGVCPCCPTAACYGPDGTLYVAFRNIKDGYRDIAIGRLKPGQSHFDGPFPVIPDTWKFNGCPHDGASLVVVGDTLHIVWMDARSGPQRCYYARSKTHDLKFEARELYPRVSGSQGNAKLFADARGQLHAVWEESLGTEPPGDSNHAAHQPPKVGAGGRVIMYAMMPVGQTEFTAARTVDPKPGAFQTRPAIVGTRTGDLFIAWNELDTKGKSVVLTRLAQSATGGQP